MAATEYVLSVLKIKSYNGNLLDEPELAFATIDDKGIMSTGYPCWTTFGNAVSFSSIDKAIDFYYRNRQYLDSNEYDLSTVEVKKCEWVTCKSIDTTISTDEYNQQKLELEERAEYERLKKKYENK